MDPKILDRMKRIQELMAKGAKATDAEKAEVKKLLDEQMAWARANPAKAMEATRAFELMKKTPEQMKAEYEAAAAQAKAAGVTFDPEASAALREEGIRAGTPESVLPKPVTPPSKFTAEMEQARTDYGKSVREAAIAAGKPVAVADAEALKAYQSWYPEMEGSGWKPEAAPDPSIEYPTTEPAAEAPKIEYDANGWYFDKATGKWIPGPDAVYKKEEAKPAEAPAVPEAPPSEATTVDIDSGVKEEAAAIATEKKPGWKDKIKDLGIKYGVPMLEILEAVGKQRGGIDKPTMLDKKYQEKLEAAQREYMENLEKQREEREAAQYEKRIAAERAWQEQQAAANRAADVAARREELSSREKLLQMQLAAQKGAAATGATIIPQ